MLSLAIHHAKGNYEMSIKHMVFNAIKAIKHISRPITLFSYRCFSIVTSSHEENVKPFQAKAAMNVGRRWSSHGPNQITNGKWCRLQPAARYGQVWDTTQPRKTLACACFPTHPVVHNSLIWKPKRGSEIRNYSLHLPLFWSTSKWQLQKQSSLKLQKNVEVLHLSWENGLENLEEAKNNL